MEPTPTGWVATLRGATDDSIAVIAIEAWHPQTGQALVVDPKTASLVPALNLPGFTGMHRTSRVVSAVPAAPGWQLSVTEGVDQRRTTRIRPIVAWVLDDEGELIPAVAGVGDNWAEMYYGGEILPPPEAGA